MGRSTGINSAKTDMARKKMSTSHILDNESKEGTKYIKRAIADTVIAPIKIFNFKGKLYYPLFFKHK